MWVEHTKKSAPNNDCCVTSNGINRSIRRVQHRSHSRSGRRKSPWPHPRVLGTPPHELLQGKQTESLDEGTLDLPDVDGTVEADNTATDGKPDNTQTRQVVSNNNNSVNAQLKSPWPRPTDTNRAAVSNPRQSAARGCDYPRDVNSHVGCVCGCSAFTCCRRP